jgi:hypothetical protein
MWAAAVIGAFVLLVALIYGLQDILSYGAGSFPPKLPSDWFRTSGIDFGADFIVHVIPMGFTAFGFAMLIPTFADRSLVTFVASFALSLVWHVIGFNWYMAPHGVISDPVDDVLIISCVFLTLVHIGIAIVRRGTPRVRSITCALAMGAATIETCVVHALIIMPSAQVYDMTATWMKESITRGSTHSTLCSKFGLTCLVQDGRAFKVEPGTEKAGVPTVVAERAIEAVAKYGIVDMPFPQEPRSWTLRHRSYDNYTGSLRMPAVEFMDGGSRKIVVDTSLAPVTNLWVRSFTHLHFLPLSIIWSILLVMLDAIHTRRRIRK